MKTIFLSIAVLFSISSFAQGGYIKMTPEQENQNQIKEIKLNLARFHEQYKQGTALYIAGAILAGAAVIVNENSSSRAPETMAILSGGFIAVGAVLQIDAHKFIGRAGRRKARNK